MFLEVIHHAGPMSEPLIPSPRGVHPSVHPLIHPSVHPSDSPSSARCSVVALSLLCVLLSFCLSVLLTVYMCICLSARPTLNSTVSLSLSFCSLVRQFVVFLLPPVVVWSARSSVFHSFCPSVRRSVHPSLRFDPSRSFRPLVSLSLHSVVRTLSHATFVR